MNLRSSLLMSRRVTSTRQPRKRSWEFSTSLSHQGSTVVLVTHDEDIAAHAERHIRLRDGRVIEDTGES